MFSIIIPTWNSVEYLKLCIASIQKNSAHPHQIIVHVNDGSDGSREWVLASGLDATYSDSNIGICFAVNEAAAMAKHDYIVYINDDMYALPGWDTALVKRIKQMPSDLFMLSGTMVEPKDSRNPCVVVANFGDSVQTFDEKGLLQQASKLVRPNWLGSTWPPTVVHRRWWQRVGGYSTELSPGMSSDNDFSMKMWHAGCRIFLGVGDSLVYHFQCKSTGKVIKNDGRKQFLNKWGMTQSTFDRFYLRRGQAAATLLLTEPDDTSALRWALRKSTLKKILN